MDRRRSSNGQFLPNNVEDCMDYVQLPVSRKLIVMLLCCCCIMCLCILPWLLLLYRLDALNSLLMFLENNVKCPPCPPCGKGSF